LKRYVDLKDRVDYEISTKPFSIMDSVKQSQVGVHLKHPPISSLSLRERVRVRGS
jgi:hypothetical protein